MPQGTQPTTGGSQCDGGMNSGKSYSREQWATDFLYAIGANGGNAGTLQWVIAWTKFETTAGTPGYNLLNTTQKGYPGAFAINSVGVQFFCSYNDGVEANAQVLKGGGYPNLLKALQSGDDASYAQLGINKQTTLGIQFALRYGFVEPNIVAEINKWGTGHSQQIAQLATDNFAVAGSQDSFPGDSTIGAKNAIQQGATDVQGALSGTTIGQFFGNLNNLFKNPNRISKGAIGVLLIVVGAVIALNILSGGKVVSSFSKAARGLT